ncbi:MAG: single-stranded-DNA-specific exonuclease RecJ [Christensenellales bacterium]|jgi:single-stranded-DNA-specific exonuclease
MRRFVRRAGIDVADAAYPPDIPDVLQRLLRARGVTDAQEFLHPEAGTLHDPMLLQGMKEAVSRLQEAKEKRKRVLIWGDYDADGVSATAILMLFFRKYGISSRFYIPSRHKEGYGLNEKGLREIAESAEVLVTVDNGIAEKALVETAMGLGLDVIVTDHHQPGDRVPNCTVINPLLGDYPYKYLCGAAVAFKLACALDAELAMDFIDIAALATVADVVPLTGENRTIVAKGLLRMNENPRPPIAALVRASGMKGKITSTDLAFRLAPRLNAGGRIGDAKRSLALLLSETDAEADERARELEQENARRKQIEDAILKDAEAQLLHYPLAQRRVIVLAGEWNKGVIGLAAGRLCEKYAMPAILFSREGGVLTGSCRSIEGVDIYAALTSVAKHLDRYGGHRQAAGLTMKEEALEAFILDIDKAIAESSDPAAFVPTAEYDAEVDLADWRIEDIEMLSLLEPTGNQNPKPVFLSEAKVVSAQRVGADGNTLRLSLESGGTETQAVWFRHGEEASRLSGQNARVLYNAEINSWQDRKNIQCLLSAAEVAWDAGNLTVTGAMFASFLSERLQKDARAQGAVPLSMHKWASLLDANPRGTLLIALTKKAVQAVLHVAQRFPPDVCIGAYPADKRGFNAVCLLPKGEFSEGYRHIVLLDAPEVLFGDVPGGSQLFRDENMGDAPWLRALCDKDMLREVYKAVRRILSRPFHRRDAMLLYRDIMECSGVPMLGALSGLYVLDHMGLISFREKPLQIVGKPPFKAEPEDDAMYQRIQAIRRERG